MMTPKDLRPGNVVGQDALNVYPPNFIAGIRPVILSKINPEDFDPVPMYCPVYLTKAWLKRFGFAQSTCDGAEWHELKPDNAPLFMTSERNGYLEVFVEGLDVRVSYVHQLQNLYFDLTKQELKVNPDGN